MSRIDLQTTFVTNLKAVRKERGLTQDALADNAGISSNHVSMIEAGRRFPSIAMIEKLAMALDIHAYELFIDHSVPQREISDSMKRVYVREVKQKLNEYIDHLETN